MTNDKATSKEATELSREHLIWAALQATLTAIGGYDAIIWKIRSGCVVILYGALTLILGTLGVPDLREITDDLSSSLSVFLLIFGFSFSIAIIDAGYVTKKLRVIVGRDLLIDVALNPTAVDKNLEKLLYITGEILMKTISSIAAQSFCSKMRWNFFGIILPLYGAAPTVAVIVYVVGILIQ